MPYFNVCLATWNCENQFPTQQQMLDFFNGLKLTRSQHNSDVVIIGLQEAEPDGQGHYVGRRLLQIPAMSRYQMIANYPMKGSTKMKTNYQYIGGLIHSSVINRFNSATFDSYGVRVSISDQGKGGVLIDLEFDNQHFGFISAHLDSKDENRRNDQIKNLLGKLGRTQNIQTAQSATIVRNLKNRFKAVFFMGDLNYRLSPNVLAQKQYNDFLLTKNATAQGMSDILVNPVLRDKLLDYDLLRDSPLINAYGFEFLPPISTHDVHTFMPTYKLKYHPTGNTNPCVLFANALPNPNATLARNCYFPDSKIKYDEGRQAFDLGWLDRVGYLLGNGVSVTLIEYKALSNIVLSDHAPVCMRLRVTY